MFQEHIAPVAIITASVSDINIPCVEYLILNPTDLIAHLHKILAKVNTWKEQSPEISQRKILILYNSTDDVELRNFRIPDKLQQHFTLMDYNSALKRGS